MGTATSDPDRGEIFSLLSNHRRRFAIHYTKLHEDPVEISDVAEQVAAWELDKNINELDYAERKRVYTSLQQTHLPTLDDAGMITFENGEVEATDQVEQLEVYMDIVPGDSIPWGEYYLGLAMLEVGVIGGVGVGILPTGVIPELGWALLLLAVFLGSAAYHVYQNRQNRLGSIDHPPSVSAGDE